MDYTTLVKGNVDKEIKAFLENPFQNKPNIFQAIEISEKYNIDLHPNFLFYWNEFKASELIPFLEFVKKNIQVKGKELHFPLTEEKRQFELLGVEHTIAKQDIEIIKSEKEANIIIFNEENKNIFLLNLGIDIRKKFNQKEFEKQIDKLIKFAENNLTKTSIEILNENNFIGIRDKAGTYIGARMGRPEKAKMRKQFNDETKSVGLFPVGEQGGRSKNIVDVIKKEGYVEEEFRTFMCEKCNKETIYPICEKCNAVTTQMCFEKYTGEVIDIHKILRVLEDSVKLYDMVKEGINLTDEFRNELTDEIEVVSKISKKSDFLNFENIEKIRNICGTFLIELDNLERPNEIVQNLIKQIRNFNNSVYFKKQKLDINSIEKQLRNLLGSDFQYPKAVKGMSSSINKHHTVEHIIKPFLRAKHNVCVFRDGTVRYDMIEMGFTHFKPKEIGTSIEKLHQLGYTHDYLGKPLENENQILEIFPQDVALPDCVESGDELASDYVFNTGNYIDELLEKLYGLPPYYNFKTKEDTIGTMLIGLAPHTSAGIVGRVIGYTKTQGCFSHPVWHAAQRRNLDGDENGILLLLDGLINFSRDYLPDRRGSRTMDVSLVLTSHLYLDQIDDEVHGMDIVPYYPQEFYEACKKYESPKSVKIEKVDKRLNEEDWDKRYLGYGFTHTTDNMNNTILCSSYKSVPSMVDKLDLQLGLGRKIRAVDEDSVGTFVIDKHFLKDIKGNLRKFSMQTFRCTNCNTKYRRPPLIGKCTKCGNASINFTIHEGSIKKYLNPSFKIIEEFNVDPYIVETIELTNLRVEGVFGKELEQQKSLTDFFGQKK